MPSVPFIWSRREPRILTARSVSVVPECLPDSVLYAFAPELRESIALAVGQNPDAVAFVSGSNLSRCQTTPLRIEPCFGKVSEDDAESPFVEERNVLHEDVARSHLANNARDVRPEPPLVLEAALFSRGAEGLAGEARSDDVHLATPETPIERGNIVPKRSWLQGLFCHARHENGRGVGVPLDVTHSSVRVSERESQSEFEARCPGT